jgi:hypothetical protein
MIGRLAITTAHAPTSGCADLPYAVTELTMWYDFRGNGVAP